MVRKIALYFAVFFALFFAFFCALILMTKLVGDFAMAREGNFKSRLTTVEPDPPAKGSLEEYLKTPKGQAIERIVDFMEAGDREGAKAAIEEFKKKWPQEPEAPKPPERKPSTYNPPPMVLPPEAR